LIKFICITPAQAFGIKLLLHIVALSLLLVTYYQAFTDQLGADPVKAIIHFTSIGAFNLLLISPLAKYLRQDQFVTLRRPIGLYTFEYATCHFTSFLIFELQLEWSLIFSELLKRPYIAVGFMALLIWRCSITLLSPISREQNLLKIILCVAFSKPSEIIG